METLSSSTSAVERVSSGRGSLAPRAAALCARHESLWLKARVFSKDVRSVFVLSFPGTIGLSLAHRVSKVIGVEVVEQAIEDARWNAAFNGEFKLAVAEGLKLTAEK